MTAGDTLARKYGLYPQIAAHYPNSLAMIEQEFSDLTDDQRRDVIYSLLIECEGARKYDWDEEKSRREQYRPDAKDVKSAAIHAKKLACHFRQKGKLLDRAFWAAQESSGIGFVNRRNTRVSIDDGFANLLEHLAHELNIKSIRAMRGRFEHRLRFGPLLFDEPIDNSVGKIRKSTALAVYFSCLLRWLDTHGRIPRNQGMPLPTKGRPRWGLVAVLVSETISEDIDQAKVNRSASKIMEENPNLKIIFL